MKRILIALAVLLAVQVADAQVKSPEAAKKALAAAQEAAQNPKKNVKVATWLKLATSYMDAYEAPAGNILLCHLRFVEHIILHRSDAWCLSHGKQSVA